MLPKYYSSWVQILFVLWVFGYIFKIDVITKYINPYYTSILMCIGFCLFIMYLIYYKNYTFEPSFLITLSLIHFIPLYISRTYVKNNYAIYNVVISLIVYCIYMNYIQKNPIDVYLHDKHPQSWKELLHMCRSKKGDLIPICIILKLIKYIY